MTQFGTRYVYLVGALSGRVHRARARAVATADLSRAHLHAQVVMAAPVAPAAAQEEFATDEGVSVVVTNAQSSGLGI